MLERFKYTSRDGKQHTLSCRFRDPAPKYFDGYFRTQFEGCIRDKFKNLEWINERPSDYIKKGLLEHGITPVNNFASVFYDDHETSKSSSAQQ